SGKTIDEVVVTAQRRSESIQDVPIAITAVGAETLRDSNVKGIEDYFALTPNVSFRSDGSRDRKDLSMRGISNQLNQYSNVRPATYAFYIDEFNVVAGTSNPQIVDLERIEVLRGPQGTYFGRNAVGGAINVITKKPGNEWYGEVGLDYSSHDTRGAHGVVNIPVVDDIFALRASGQIEESDGWISNINPVGGGNDYDYKTARLQARLTPGDNLTWDFAYSYSDEETGMRVGVPTGFITATWRAVYYGNQQGDITNPDGVGFYPSNDDRVNFNRPQRVGSQYDYLSSRAVYEFENMSLTAVVGQIKSDVFNYGDVDGGSPDFYYENLLLKREGTSGELRLQSLGADRLEWSFGASIGEDKGRMRQYTYHGAQSPQGRPEGTETTAGESDASSNYWAAFGQATWRFADQWHMVVGGRYSYEKVDTYAVSRSNGVLTGINDREVDFDDFSPRFTLGWEPASNVLAYVTASRGFKSGGTQTSNNINLSNEFKPEILWNYEAGLKLDLLNRKLRLDGTVFFMDWKDVQQLIRFQFLDNTGAIRAVSGIANAAKASSYGAELSADAAITERFKLSTQVGYLRAKYDDYPAALIDGLVLDLSGKTLVDAPRWTFGAQAHYQMPLTSTLEGFARAEFNYRDEALGNPYVYRYYQWPFITPSYSVTNLRFGVEGEKLRVVAYAENLFDKDYFFNSYEKAFYSGVQVEPSTRIFGVSLSYKFQ
ncbi:MAG TPA: TonB-dependent receptor, partial [Steroidobacteraceae bacterium]|nr:TonB-dependent receptor [Steroidobacteraceae bacterium]